MNKKEEQRTIRWIQDSVIMILWGIGCILLSIAFKGIFEFISIIFFSLMIFWKSYNLRKDFG